MVSHFYCHRHQILLHFHLLPNKKSFMPHLVTFSRNPGFSSPVFKVAITAIISSRTKNIRTPIATHFSSPPAKYINGKVTRGRIRIPSIIKGSACREEENGVAWDKERCGSSLRLHCFSDLLLDLSVPVGSYSLSFSQNFFTISNSHTGEYIKFAKTSK